MCLGQIFRSRLDTKAAMYVHDDRRKHPKGPKDPIIRYLVLG